MSDERKEIDIPFEESRRGSFSDIEKKAAAGRLGRYLASRIVDRPNIGDLTPGDGRRRRRGINIDLPTGGRPGTRKPTGSRRDPDQDGWSDEGTTHPIWVGFDNNNDPSAESKYFATLEAEEGYVFPKAQGQQQFTAIPIGDESGLPMRLSSGRDKIPLVEDDWATRTPPRKRRDYQVDDDGFIVREPPIARKDIRLSGRNYVMEIDAQGEVTVYGGWGKKRAIAYLLVSRGKKFQTNGKIWNSPNGKVYEGLMTDDSRYHHIDMISVDRKHRRRGIATEMLRFVEETYGGQVQHSQSLSDEGRQFRDADVSRNKTPAVALLSSGKISEFRAERERRRIEKELRRQIDDGDIYESDVKTLKEYFAGFYRGINEYFHQRVVAQLYPRAAYEESQRAAAVSSAYRTLMKPDVALEFDKMFNRHAIPLDRTIKVFRGQRLPKKIADSELEEGRIFRPTSFISTSTSKSTAELFMYSMSGRAYENTDNTIPVLFELRAERGTPALANITGEMEGERELLFGRDVSIEIEEVIDEVGGIIDSDGEKEFTYKRIIGTLSSGKSPDNDRTPETSIYTNDKSHNSKEISELQISGLSSGLNPDEKNIRHQAILHGVDIAPFFDTSNDDDDVSESTSDWSLSKSGKQRAGDAIIIRTNENGERELLTITRGRGPFRGALALPGGMFDEELDDNLQSVAGREMEEEVNISPSVATNVTNLGVIDDPNWDPRFVDGAEVGATRFDIDYEASLAARAGDDASKFQWVSLEDISRGRYSIAFGHAQWLARAFENEKELSDRFDVLAQASSIRNARLIKKIDSVRRDKGLPTFADRKLSSGLTDRPPIPVGDGRPRRPWIPMRQKSGDRGVTGYGKKENDGRTTRRGNSQWLKGMTTTEMAVALVPTSEEEHFEMWADEYAPTWRTFGTEQQRKEYRAQLEAFWKDRFKETATIQIDYSPEAVEASRKLIQDSLDTNPGLRWLFETHGAPIIGIFTREASRLDDEYFANSEKGKTLRRQRGWEFDPWTKGRSLGWVDTIGLHPKFAIDNLTQGERGRHVPGIRLLQDDITPGPGSAHIGTSVQAAIIHEYGHWLHNKILFEKESYGKTSKDRIHYGSGNKSDPMYLEAFNVAEKYEPREINATTMAIADRIIAGELTPEEAMRMFSEMPVTVSSYGNSSRREAFAEALVAILHPDKTVREKMISSSLRRDVFHAIGVSDEKNIPWEKPGASLSSGKTDDDSSRRRRESRRDRIQTALRQLFPSDENAGEDDRSRQSRLAKMFTPRASEKLSKETPTPRENSLIEETTLDVAQIEVDEIIKEQYKYPRTQTQLQRPGAQSAEAAKSHIARQIAILTDDDFDFDDYMEAMSRDINTEERLGQEGSIPSGMLFSSSSNFRQIQEVLRRDDNKSGLFFVDSQGQVSSFALALNKIEMQIVEARTKSVLAETLTWDEMVARRQILKDTPGLVPYYSNPGKDRLMSEHESLFELPNDAADVKRMLKDPKYSILQKLGIFSESDSDNDVLRKASTIHFSTSPRITQLDHAMTLVERVKKTPDKVILCRLTRNDARLVAESDMDDLQSLPMFITDWRDSQISYMPDVDAHLDVLQKLMPDGKTLKKVEDFTEGDWDALRAFAYSQRNIDPDVLFGRFKASPGMTQDEIEKTLSQRNIDAALQFLQAIEKSGGYVLMTGDTVDSPEVKQALASYVIGLDKSILTLDDEIDDFGGIRERLQLGTAAIEDVIKQLQSAAGKDGVLLPRENKIFKGEHNAIKLYDINTPAGKAAAKRALVSDLIHTWAISSNDENPVALTIQHQVRQMFGLDDAAGWYAGYRLRNTDRSILERGAIPSSGRGNMSAIDFDDAVLLDNDQEEIIQSFLVAVYEATQQYYKEKGITHIPVWRGVQLNVGANEVELTDIASRMRPLSAWTTNYKIAQQFSGNPHIDIGRPGSGQYNWQSGSILDRSATVIKTWVPIEQIFSNALTGFGCLNEDEIVVLGRETPALATVSPIFAHGLIEKEYNPLSILTDLPRDVREILKAAYKNNHNDDDPESFDDLPVNIQQSLIQEHTDAILSIRKMREMGHEAFTARNRQSPKRENVNADDPFTSATAEQAEALSSGKITQPSSPPGLAEDKIPAVSEQDLYYGQGIMEDTLLIPSAPEIDGYIFTQELANRYQRAKTPEERQNIKDEALDLARQKNNPESRAKAYVASQIAESLRDIPLEDLLSMFGRGRGTIPYITSWRQPPFISDKTPNIEELLALLANLRNISEDASASQIQRDAAPWFIIGSTEGNVLPLDEHVAEKLRRDIFMRMLDELQDSVGVKELLRVYGMREKHARLAFGLINGLFSEDEIPIQLRIPTIGKDGKLSEKEFAEKFPDLAKIGYRADNEDGQFGTGFTGDIAYYLNPETGEISFTKLDDPQAPGHTVLLRKTSALTPEKLERIWHRPIMERLRIADLIRYSITTLDPPKTAVVISNTDVRSNTGMSIILMNPEDAIEFKKAMELGKKGLQKRRARMSKDMGDKELSEALIALDKFVKLYKNDFTITADDTVRNFGMRIFEKSSIDLLDAEKLDTDSGEAIMESIIFQPLREQFKSGYFSTERYRMPPPILGRKPSRYSDARVITGADGVIDEMLFASDDNPSRVLDIRTEEGQHAARTAIISDLIHTWAVSSNNENPLALTIQHEIRKIFGLDKASGWNITPDGSMTPSGFIRSAPATRGLPLDQITRNFDTANELDEKQTELLHRFISAMYHATQEYFANRGVKHVAVWRGTGIDTNGEIPNPTFSAISLLRPASSWASTYQSAHNFTSTFEVTPDDFLSSAIGQISADIDSAVSSLGNREMTPEEYLKIIEAEPGASIYDENPHGPGLVYSIVPVEQVLSTPLTGFGCRSEDEIVILGRPTKSIVFSSTDSSWRLDTKTLKAFPSGGRDVHMFLGDTDRIEVYGGSSESGQQEYIDELVNNYLEDLFAERFIPLLGLSDRELVQLEDDKQALAIVRGQFILHMATGAAQDGNISVKPFVLKADTGQKLWDATKKRLISRFNEIYKQSKLRKQLTFERQISAQEFDDLITELDNAGGLTRPIIGSSSDDTAMALSSGATLRFRAIEMRKRAADMTFTFERNEERSSAIARTLEKGFAGGFTVDVGPSADDITSGISIARNKHGLIFDISLDISPDGTPSDEVLTKFLDWIDFHGPSTFTAPKDGAVEVALGGWVSDGKLYLDVVDIYPNTEQNLSRAAALGKEEDQMAVTNLDLLWELKRQNKDISPAFIDSGGTGGFTIDERSIEKFSAAMRQLDRNRQLTGDRLLLNIGTPKVFKNGVISSANRVRYVDYENNSANDYWIVTTRSGIALAFTHEQFEKEKKRLGSRLNKNTSVQDVLTSLHNANDVRAIAQLSPPTRKNPNPTSAGVDSPHQQRGLGNALRHSQRNDFASRGLSSGLGPYPWGDARYPDGVNDELYDEAWGPRNPRGRSRRAGQNARGALPFDPTADTVIERITAEERRDRVRAFRENERLKKEREELKKEQRRQRREARQKRKEQEDNNTQSLSSGKDDETNDRVREFLRNENFRFLSGLELGLPDIETMLPETYDFEKKKHVRPIDIVKRELEEADIVLDTARIDISDDGIKELYKLRHNYPVWDNEDPRNREWQEAVRFGDPVMVLRGRHKRAEELELDEFGPVDDFDTAPRLDANQIEALAVSADALQTMMASESTLVDSSIEARDRYARGVVDARQRIRNIPLEDWTKDDGRPTPEARQALEEYIRFLRYSLSYNHDARKAHMRFLRLQDRYRWIERRVGKNSLASITASSVPELQISEETKQIAKSRAKQALMRRLSKFSEYVRERYGENDAPWLDMTESRIQSILSEYESSNGNYKTIEPLFNWAEEMYKHDKIIGKNGRTYRVVPEARKILMGRSRIQVSLLIEVLEGTNSDGEGIWSEVGGGKRIINLEEKSVYHSSLFITNQNNKAQGLSEIINQHSWMFLKAAGFKFATLEPVDDGVYVWARTGWSSPITARNIGAITRQLRAFETGGSSIVKNKDDKEIIEALINMWRADKDSVRHMDFIFAISPPDKSLPREEQEKQSAETIEWFKRSFSINDAGFDFEENGISEDPRRRTLSSGRTRGIHVSEIYDRTGPEENWEEGQDLTPDSLWRLINFVFEENDVDATLPKYDGALEQIEGYRDWGSATNDTLRIARDEDNWRDLLSPYSAMYRLLMDNRTTAGITLHRFVERTADLESIKEGDTFSDKGFQSFTILPIKSYSGMGFERPIILRLLTTKNTRGRYVSRRPKNYSFSDKRPRREEYFSRGGELEVLLPAGATYKLVKKTITDDGREIWDVRLTSQGKLSSGAIEVALNNLPTPNENEINDSDGSASLSSGRINIRPETKTESDNTAFNPENPRHIGNHLTSRSTALDVRPEPVDSYDDAVNSGAPLRILTPGSYHPLLESAMDEITERMAELNVRSSLEMHSPLSRPGWYRNTRDAERESFKALADVEIVLKRLIDDGILDKRIEENPFAYRQLIRGLALRALIHGFQISNLRAVKLLEDDSVTEETLKEWNASIVRVLLNNSPTQKRSIRSLDELMEEAEVGIGMTLPGLLQMVKDGEFKTLHETGTSRGNQFAHDARISSEFAMFGILPHSTSRRPISGVLTVGGVTPKSMVQSNQYGPVRIVLKKDVNSRVTWTEVDSLTFMPSASSLANPSQHGLTHQEYISQKESEATFVASKRGSRGTMKYTEAQVHGGVTIDDIAYVIVDTGVLNVWPDTYSDTSGVHRSINDVPEYKELVELLKERGIPITVVNLIDALMQVSGHLASWEKDDITRDIIEPGEDDELG